MPSKKNFLSTESSGLPTGPSREEVNAALKYILRNDVSSSVRSLPYLYPITRKSPDAESRKSEASEENINKVDIRLTDYDTDHTSRRDVMNRSPNGNKRKQEGTDSDFNSWIDSSENSPTRGMSDMIRLAFSSQVSSEDKNHDPLIFDRVSLYRERDSGYH